VWGEETSGVIKNKDLMQLLLPIQIRRNCNTILFTRTSQRTSEW